MPGRFVRIGMLAFVSDDIFVKTISPKVCKILAVTISCFASVVHASPSVKLLCIVSGTGSPWQMQPGEQIYKIDYQNKTINGVNAIITEDSIMWEIHQSSDGTGALIYRFIISRVTGDLTAYANVTDGRGGMKLDLMNQGSCRPAGKPKF
jgi:hypothetical protein